jgi:hypothetical protein
VAAVAVELVAIVVVILIAEAIVRLNLIACHDLRKTQLHISISCIIKRHAMKTYWGVEVQLLVFLLTR